MLIYCIRIQGAAPVIFIVSIGDIASNTFTLEEKFKIRGEKYGLVEEKIELKAED